VEDTLFSGRTIEAGREMGIAFLAEWILWAAALFFYDE
jgi:hypothetical protein